MKKTITALLVATTISNASICNEIKTRTDEFTGDIQQHNPYHSPTGFPSMFLHKYIEKESVIYSLNLTAKSSSYYRGEGVIIKFYDGTTYSFPEEKINVSRYDGEWNYDSHVILTSEEVVMFQNKKIEKYELYIFSNTITPEESIRFNLFVNCLTAVKKEQ